MEGRLHSTTDGEYGQSASDSASEQEGARKDSGREKSARGVSETGRADEGQADDRRDREDNEGLSEGVREVLSDGTTSVATEGEGARRGAEITSAVNTLAEKLNTPVEIVQDVTSLDDARKRGSKGWYENGKVYLVFLTPLV